MQVMLLNRNQARMIRASALGSFAALFIVSASNFIVAQETPKVIVPAQGDTGLKDPKSYALGFQVGKDMAPQNALVDDKIQVSENGRIRAQRPKLRHGSGRGEQ